MKSFVLTLVFASALFAQDQTQADRWRSTKTGWRQVAETTDEPPIYWLYEKFHQRGSDVEVWMKMYDPELTLKMKAKAKTKRYSHQLQFYTFHCGTRRVSIDDAIWYDTRGNVIGSENWQIYRVPVPPESALEIMYRHFCLVTR